MSATTPPLSPEAEKEARLRDIQKLYEEYLRLAEGARRASHASSTPERTNYVTSPLSTWLPGVITSVLQGITLVSLLGFAFWFGGVSKTVDNTAERLKTVESAISGDRREGLSNRMSVVETKLDNLVDRMGVIETKLDSLDKKLDPPLRTR
jgi:hypothetical protein